MEWESVLGELVAFIKNVAPDIWAIYIRQVVLEGTAYLAGSIGLLLMSLWLFRTAKRQPTSKYGDELSAGFFTGLGCIALFFTGLCLFSALNYFMNPEYFVIQALLRLVQ